MKPLSIIVLSILLIAGGAAAAENANELFQQALVKERTEGNLPEAIKLYQRILAKYAGNRKVAAQALLQLADCQSKLGDVQARTSLERLVREFGDQKDTAAEASRRLAALGEASSRGVQTTKAIWTGANVDPGSVSADGRYMYNTDWSTGDLRVHDFSTGEDRHLTAKGTWVQSADFGEQPVVSKDGKQLAYAWFVESKGRYQLLLAGVPPSGMLQPRVLFDQEDVKWIAPTDWSRDGEWLAVEFQRRDRTSGIGLVSTRDGTLRVLQSGPAHFAGGSLSPDSKYLAYWIYSEDGPSARQRGFILAIDGKSEVPLTAGAVTSASLLWTPDGGRVVFTTDLGGTDGLWSARVADGKPQGDPELLQRDFRDSYPLGFTRNGSLAYAVTRASADVYVSGLDPTTGKLTSEPKRVNQRAIGNSWGRTGWLADGNAVSFWSRRNARDFLVVHSLTTGEEQDLREQQAGYGAGHGYAGWFADGKTLLTWGRKGETMHFRRENPWSGEVLGAWSAPSTGSGNYHPMTFSLDLMTMFYTKKVAPDCQGKCTFVVIGRRLDDGKDREILRMNAWTVGQPWPSPDGREIAFFTRNDRLTPALTVAALDSGAAREIYRDPEMQVSGRLLAWTADSSHVLAFSTERGREALWSFPAKGGAPLKSPIGMRIGNSLNCAVSPDGRQLLFVGGGRDTEIWTMGGVISAKSMATR